jgi:hypothetical protein
MGRLDADAISSSRSFYSSPAPRSGLARGRWPDPTLSLGGWLYVTFFLPIASPYNASLLYGDCLERYVPWASLLESSP